MLRAGAGIAAVFALLYAAICWWVYAHQRELLYFPQVTRTEAGTTDFSLRRDGVVLRGWALDRDGGDPILYFGGNAEAVERNRDAFARWFAGRSVYLLAYRGYGASDGQPGEAALQADALAFYDAVAARHPGRPVDLIGRSLGSGIAAYVVAHRPVARLVLVTPYGRMADVAAAHYPWLPVRRLLRERYDSIAALREFRGPVLILRAGRDAVVPPSSTDDLIASLPRPPRVVAFPAAGHDDLSIDPAYGQALADFMR